MKITKKALKAFVREMVATDSRWTLRALRVIYSFQTDTEKATEQTSVHNTVGFTGCDAEFLTSLAKQYERRGSLSDRQMKILYRVMPKYWRQLIDASNKEKLEESYIKYLAKKELEKEQGEFELEA